MSTVKKRKETHQIPKIANKPKKGFSYTSHASIKYPSFPTHLRNLVEVKGLNLIIKKILQQPANKVPESEPS